jgi:predicted nucleic acid-binding protein
LKQIVVDSNVLVSFLTDRDLEQQDQAANLFRAAADGEVTLVLHQTVISELVYVLTQVYGLRTKEVAPAIGDLLDLPGVTAVDEVAWPLVLELWPERIAAFGDAMIAAVAQRGRCDAVATFDVKLTRALRRLGLHSFW